MTSSSTSAPSSSPGLASTGASIRRRSRPDHSLLLAAFVAGNVRAQLRAEKAEDDTYSGWIFAIDAYKRLRIQDPFRSPSIENLRKMEEAGTLQQHAKDVQFREEDGDAPRPPMV